MLVHLISLNEGLLIFVRACACHIAAAIAATAFCFFAIAACRASRPTPPPPSSHQNIRGFRLRSQRFPYWDQNWTHAKRRKSHHSFSSLVTLFCRRVWAFDWGGGCFKVDLCLLFGFFSFRHLLRFFCLTLPWLVNRGYKDELGFLQGGLHVTMM